MSYPAVKEGKGKDKAKAKVGAVMHHPTTSWQVRYSN
jgi:hypothetical protein